MSLRSVIYLIDPGPYNSPFDVNMAIDANYDIVLPYNNITLEQIPGLTQDAIFSRGNDGIKHTGFFIGGRDINLALSMLKASQEAMVPPFKISVMADPSGGFTTAAAMVYLASRQLRERFSCDLTNLNVIVFGGTGPVGIATAILSAQAGASVTIVTHSSVDKALEVADSFGKQFNVTLKATQAVSEADNSYLIHNADVIFCAAKAGVQVLSKTIMTDALQLKVAVDANAVPPLGIDGIKRTDNAVPIKYATRTDAVGIGALRVGAFKNELQSHLLKSMLTYAEPVFIDFTFAYKIACQLDDADA